MDNVLVKQIISVTKPTKIYATQRNFKKKTLKPTKSYTINPLVTAQIHYKHSIASEPVSQLKHTRYYESVNTLWAELR